MKAHYFISNQYGTSNYELVKEMMLLVKKNTQCCGDSKKAINTVPIIDCNEYAYLPNP